MQTKDSYTAKGNCGSILCFDEEFQIYDTGAEQKAKRTTQGTAGGLFETFPADEGVPSRGSLLFGHAPWRFN